MRSSGFISKAACRGYRPSRFAPYKGKLRSHLIARLAKERSIARFIVAPDGYGKTSLAVDYAETMFSWTHVFWVNAKSPCFIRDLDNGGISDGCFKVDSDAKLVVFDDVPQLDASRLKRFSKEIDALLSGNCEVIVICTPSCDLLGSLQIDRVRISATDLLLTDEELDAALSEEDRLRFTTSYAPAARRVPVLVWDSSPESTIAFVSGNLNENLPSDLLLVAFSSFVLQQGTLTDLSNICPIDMPLMSETLVDYPHFGFNVETGRFEAPLVNIEHLARAAKGKLDELVGRSSFATRDELVCAWADILLARGFTADRACDTMRELGQMKSRIAWLAKHARELVRCGCFYATHRLVGSLKSGRYESKERILALDAVCCRMLGDKDAAIRNAKRCAFESVAQDDARVVGLLILANHTYGQLRESAQLSLRTWEQTMRSSGKAPLSWHEALVVAWVASQDGVERLGATWMMLRQTGVDDDALCLVASWLFGAAGQAWSEGATFDERPLDAAQQYIRSRLTDGETLPIDFFATSAGLSMEEAHAKGMAYSNGPLEAGVLLGLRRVEMAMLMQRRAFSQVQHEEQVRRSELMPDGPLYGGINTNPPVLEQRAVPLLELKTFGRLDVSIGGVPLDPKKIGRKQTRVLLLVLAANLGRDISRDATAQMMWPAKTLESARKNFYTTWSQLRHALMLPDGTCPYLLKHQYGCRLDDRYVKSDLARLDDICRELLFGPVDSDEWYEIYTEIDRDFTGDLLPVEERSALVAKIRDEYRGRLVDALVTATLRLIEAGHPQRGIWFAREAIKREPVREDAYVALMRAQIAHDQRTAAMMTYLSCRRVLSEELGIDPSPETTALYESLLGDG